MGSLRAKSHLKSCQSYDRGSPLAVRGRMSGRTFFKTSNFDLKRLTMPLWKDLKLLKNIFSTYNIGGFLGSLQVRICRAMITYVHFKKKSFYFYIHHFSTIIFFRNIFFEEHLKLINTM